MKIGDYVTVQEIASQSECRWVVISDLVEGKYGITGGIVRCIEDTRENAGAVYVDLNLSGTDALLVSGSLEEDKLVVGGIFVE